MNRVRILLQAANDPKDLLSTKEKAKDMPDGLTVVFMERGTEKGQIAVELIIRCNDIFGRETIVGFTVTENNFEGIMGAFIGARMRWNRMPMGQFDLVKGYVAECFEKFLNRLPADQTFSKEDIKTKVENYLKKP